MNIEVVAVGTELLLGQIVNGNAATIGAALADAGLDSFRQTVVGDNRERLAAAIREALERADAVIITGGIGPTQDDLTREAMCDATGLAMTFSEEYAEHLRRWWETRGREMPESNLKQAQRPGGAQLIRNEKGTAPGLDLEVARGRLFALPGVPQEMEAMLAGYVIPVLRRAAGDDSVLVNRLLRTWGLSESKVADLLDDLYAGAVNPTLAFLASGGEIKLRITAKAISAAAAQDLIEPLETEIRRRLGPAVFGADADTVEHVILRLARERGWKLASAESATAGMVAARLTSVSGASEVFAGGVVAYGTEQKTALLGVSAEVLARGVVTEETALAMADGAARRTGADAVVAVTGSAGPDPQEQPPGTMVFAVVTPEERQVRSIRLPGDRERVRTYGSAAALHFLRMGLQGLPLRGW